MSIQKVREYFKELGIEERIREFEVSSATVELAAIAVGVEGARIAKTLSFKVEEEPILIVAAGDAKVNNGAYKTNNLTSLICTTFARFECVGRLKTKSRSSRRIRTTVRSCLRARLELMPVDSNRHP